MSRHDPPVPVRWVDGIPLAAPVETLLACARHLGLLDMVVPVDAALHLESCSAEDLRSVAGQRRRGAPLLRRTLRYADPRSESPWESMLRMLHVACDVPVEPQYQVFDENGAFVARGDLWIKGTRTLQEYDGAEHRATVRHREDLRRERQIGNTSWTRRGYTSQEVLRQAVGILRDADLSLGRVHDPHRIRAWHTLLADSLFTARGTEALRCRWRLPPAGTGGDRSVASA